MRANTCQIKGKKDKIHETMPTSCIRTLPIGRRKSSFISLAVRMNDVEEFSKQSSCFDGVKSYVALIYVGLTGDICGDFRPLFSSKCS